MVVPMFPTHATPHQIASLLPKLKDPDPDIRFMSLNDLMHLLQAGHATFLTHVHALCAQILEGLLHTLVDQNGDVQNNAIKCLGPFVEKVPGAILYTLLDKVSSLNTDKTVDGSVVCLAVRAVVVALPHPAPGLPRNNHIEEAYSAVSRALVPRLLGSDPARSASAARGLLQAEIEDGQDNNALDVLNQVARCFGPMLQETEIKSLQEALTEVLLSRRCGSVMKRKAILALSTLSRSATDSQLGAFVSYSIEILRQATPIQPQTKVFLNAYTSLAKAIPQRFGPYLKTLMSFVLSPLGQDLLDRQTEAEDESDDVGESQLEDTREAALLALDAFQTFCANETLPYRGQTIDAARRFVAYDPNFAQAQNDMEAGNGMDDLSDDDFEEEAGFEDEDDVSWKLRRCAAKLLHSQVSDLGLLEDDTLFSSITESLLQRCSDREESVRLEVLAAVTTLIKNIGLADASSHDSDPALASTDRLQGRKRRRVNSSASNFDILMSNGYNSPTTPSTRSKAQDRLARISPTLVPQMLNLLVTSTTTSKQASATLLRELVIAQQGRPLLDLDSVLDATLRCIDNTSDSDQTLRVQALRLLNVIAEGHSSTLLQSSLERAVTTLINSAKVRYSKVAVEAMSALETYIKVMTPPRKAASSPSSGPLLHQTVDILQQCIKNPETDTEVRSKAIRAIGLIVGRTTGTEGALLLGTPTKTAAQDLIADRLRGELTRMASIDAVYTIARMTQQASEIRPSWTTEVALELGAQLRKVDRALRNASLGALRALVESPICRSTFEGSTIDSLLGLVMPLLSDDDLKTMASALVIVGKAVEDRPDNASRTDLSSALCEVLKKPVTGSTLEALLSTIEAIGKQGKGKLLMTAMLKDVGVTGVLAIVGQSIGTLLVSGGPDLEVTLDSFKAELHESPDEARKCLALYVLGEAGLRLGSAGALEPGDFIKCFDSSSDRVSLAAATALGRACAGNVQAFLPQIVAAMDGPSKYLLLHSAKEVLQHSKAEPTIMQHSRQLWDKLITAAQVEDYKTIGAECIGRLAIMDPATYVPQMESYLNDPQSGVRGMVITAFNFTFAEAEARFERFVEPVMVPLLSKMLNDEDVDNRRLALNTVCSAIHNTPQPVLSQLGKLLPLIFQETHIRPELVRIVNMGPFKHEVDEGLETRKAAYSTLYLLMETSINHVPINMLYDRIVAGIGDEHEIKLLCCLSLSRLIALAPDATLQRLDSLATAFRTIIAFKPKENTVKHELEKIGERCKAIIKVSAQIDKAFVTELQAESARSWREYWSWVKTETPAYVKAAEGELREKDT